MTAHELRRQADDITRQIGQDQIDRSRRLADLLIHGRDTNFAASPTRREGRRPKHPASHSSISSPNAAVDTAPSAAAAGGLRRLGRLVAFLFTGGSEGHAHNRYHA